MMQDTRSVCIRIRIITTRVYESDDAYFADLEKVGEVAKEQIGFVPCFIRFPGGSSNMVSAQYNKGIMTRLVKSVSGKGIPVL